MFTDIAAEAGLTARFVQGEALKKKFIVEANGTGVAFLDYDNDGRLDVYLVNSTRLNEPAKGARPTSHLYRNTGNGKFADVTAKAGVGRSGWGNGVCTGDFNNDGKEDLYVTYWGPNSLYRNGGDGTFSDVAAEAGVAGPADEWTTGCSFLDYDRDGRLDLITASYVRFDLKQTPLPGQAPFCLFREKPVYCGPRGLPSGQVTLFRNNGDGTFKDVSDVSGVRKINTLYAFTIAAADLNGDGWTDAYVACDSTPSLLFRNNRDGTFTELGTESGVAFNENGTEQAGMGIAVADFNNDGLPDLTKTNFNRDYPNLYANLGRGVFEDKSVASGLAVNPDYLLWGAALEDFDNDGRRDVFYAAGHVYADIATIDPGYRYAVPRLLYRQLPGNRFEDVSGSAGPGIAAAHASRGAAFGDFDNDGDIDILIMNMDEPPSLLRNDLSGQNHWMGVQLRGTVSNRSAIGAMLTIEVDGSTQTAYALSQSSYLSANDARLHFGLGASDRVERFRVRWPSGATEEFPASKADKYILLVEGTGSTASR